MKNKFLYFSILASSIVGCNTPNSNSDGKRLYDLKCLNCHQEIGQGVGKLIPALTDKNYLSTNREKLACIIQNGLDKTITINGDTYSEKMPPTSSLTNADMVNVLNYIGQNWGNDLKPFTMKEVEVSLSNCK